MKTYVLAAVSAAVLMAGTAVLADQEEGGPGERPRHHRGGPGQGMMDPAMMVERMSRHLDLDEIQQQNIGNIVEAAKPELDALRARMHANKTAMHDLDPNDPDYSAKLDRLAVENGELVAEGTVLFGRVRAEVNKELTDEQREQLRAGAEQRRERMGERRHRKD